MGGSQSFYDRIMALPESERKEQYQRYVEQNLRKLKNIEVPAGLKKKVYKSGHHVIKTPMPGLMLVGLEGSSLDCIQKCNI